MAEVNKTLEMPVKVTYKPTGEKYILDFSRRTAQMAQEQGLDLRQITQKITTIIPDLFYYSLLKEQKFVTRNGAKALFTKLFPDGMPDTLFERLVNLYVQASTTNVIYSADDEDADEKNADTEVE